MSQSIQTSVDLTVNDIRPKQRDGIEELVGGDWLQIREFLFSPIALAWNLSRLISRQRKTELKS